MESVGILRALWHRRLAVALGALLAVAVAANAIYQVSLVPPKLGSPNSSSGYARQRVLVDTPTSLVADARAKGAASIVTRASLLGGLLSSEEAKAAIAHRIGVRPSDVGVVGPGSTVPAVGTPLAEQAIQVAQPHEPYVVSVSEEPGLPVLSVLASAPDPQSAVRLGRAAIEALASGASQNPSFAGDAKIERVGNSVVGSKDEGVGKAKASIAAIVLFVLWCTAIVLLDGLVLGRRPHQARARGQSARA